MALVKKYSVLFALFLVASVHMHMIAFFSYDRAIAAAHQGNIQQAEQLMSSALIDAPDSSSHLYDAGVLAYKKGDAEHAATYFKQAAELSAQSDASLHEQALFNLGNSYVKQQKLEEALSTYEDLLRAHPDNERAKKNKEIVEELLKKKEEEKKQEEQQKQNNQNNQQQQQDQKQQQGSSQNKDKNSDSNQSKDGSSEKQKSDGQNDQNEQQGENGDQSENESEGRNDSKEQDGQEDRDNGADEQDKRQQQNAQQESRQDDRQKQSQQNNQQSNSQQNAAQQQQKQGAGEKKQAGGAGQEQKNNKSLQALDAALAEIIEQQDKQDAQLNKQLVKILMDNQQPKRSKNGNAPRW